jgi:hypothetical protein
MVCYTFCTMSCIDTIKTCHISCSIYTCMSMACHGANLLACRNPAQLGAALAWHGTGWQGNVIQYMVCRSSLEMDTQEESTGSICTQIQCQTLMNCGRTCARMQHCCTGVVHTLKKSKTCRYTHMYPCAHFITAQGNKRLHFLPALAPWSTPLLTRPHA